MTDRAAPMSSEEDARERVLDEAATWHDAASAYEKRLDPRWTEADRRTAYEDAERRREAFTTALDNYQSAIERRVLAQQPLPLEIVRVYGKLSDYEDQGIFLCGPGHPLWESTLRELCQTIRKEFGPLMGRDLMSMPIAAQPQETSR